MKTILSITVIGLFVLCFSHIAALQAEELPNYTNDNASAGLIGGVLDNGTAIALADGAEGVHTLSLANGVEVTIFTSENLDKRLESINGESIIPLDDGRYFTVITDINDPAITNKGDGAFHPFQMDQVIEVLRTINHHQLNLNLTVYLLPYPRRNVLVSSASGTEIYLSPHVLEIAPQVTAYIVTHEVGHIFQFQNIPDINSNAWARYKTIRGITNTTRFSDYGPHAYRPKEIFAEDFRVLFGNEQARYGGAIENPELCSPELVAGLKSFMLNLEPVPVEPMVIASLKGFPNPFNPRTEIALELGEDFTPSRERVTIRIYDITGALVRDLYDGVPVSHHLQVEWDGRSDHGERVASAPYFAQVRAGANSKTIKLVMIK
jgi:hypothetical protein